MTDEEILKIIDDIEKSEESKENYFGFYEDRLIESLIIKANKSGLTLYASVLLKASLEYDSKTEESNMNYLKLDDDWIDDSSDMFIEYIEKNDTIINIEESKMNWRDYLLRAGFVVILILLGVCLIIGFSTVVGWLF
jgi:hypothetical protein